MRYNKSGKSYDKSIGKRFSSFCIHFAVGLFVTFLLAQVLLQYFASWTERSLETQEQFSSYWSEIKDLDLLLYTFSQTPAQELGYEGKQTAEVLLERAGLLAERMADARGADLLILTEHLEEAVRKLEKIEIADQKNVFVKEAQSLVQMLQDLYEGFYQALENYLRDCQKIQIFVRLGVSLLMLFFGIAIIAFFMLQSRKLSSHVLRPVQELTGQAEAIIAGNEKIDLRYVEKPEDELGILNNAFYGMVETNRNNMEQLRQKGELEMKLVNARADYLELQVKLDRTRLRLLQSRVNPHFMFNILNTIAGLAVEEDADRTSRFTTKTASYFRYSLVSLDKTVKLKEEIENVRLYLEIQKERFGKRMNWEIELPENCAEVSVPAMILQPLCENAMIHGMGPLTRPVFIRVSVRENGEYLAVSVSDNGAGISGEVLERLRKEMQEWRTYDDTGGIGIGNTFQRIQMFYDGGAAFEIDSRPLECTKITFRLPRKPEEGKRDRKRGIRDESCTGR